jgi:formate dehydrogenase iron-sulfur subunit
MKLTRRTFFKVNAVAAAAMMDPARPASASVVSGDRPDGRAMLVDTTRCVGCRACEAACSEANGNAEPAMLGDDRVFDRHRDLEPQAYTVVNRYPVPASATGGVRYIKTQCMHCVDPACASACPARALEKTDTGPVVYHGGRCLGCRYCMVACPFDAPTFEFAHAVPYVKKCTFCAARQANGLPPACAEVCPSGALQFGRRDALLEEARLRIYQNPAKYAHHIYGEHEAGGTSWLYISDMEPETLGLKAGLSTTPYPELTKTALSAVPIVMTLWPPLLMALYSFSRRRDGVVADETTADDQTIKEDRHA